MRTLAKAIGLAALFASSSSLAHAEEKSIVLLYSHDIQGELEPCGCSKSPVGGFARRATAVAAVRKEAGDRPVLLVDAGNFLFDASEKSNYSDDFLALRGSHMIQLFGIMNYDALGLGGFDLLEGARMVGYLAGRGRSPVFSSNLRLESSIEHTHVGADGQIFTHNDGTGNTDPIVTLNRGGRTFQLLSFTDKYPRTSLASGFLLDPPMEQWEKLLPVVRERDGFVIVLASLPDESAIKMAKDLGKKGVVIRRTQSMPETDIPPNLLGTNSLRGQILGRSDIALDAEGNWSKIESASILLDGRVAPDERVMKLRQDYNSKLEDVEVFRFAEAPPYVRRYAGAEKCGECHVAQMTWWKSSAHAGAMATLEKSQSQFNPDCVSCHVTGYGDYYGFKRHTAKPDLANVQCESCHGIESSMMHGVYTESEWKKEQAVPEGYGEEQWKVVGPAVKKRKQQANRDAFVAGLESTCVTCHTPEHSEGFDFKSYLARMKCPLGLPDVKIIPDPPAAKPAKP